MAGYVVGDIDMSDLYPVPFPKDVPIIKLDTISLRKILENDDAEIKRLFESLKEPGFFNLDLKDHPIGIELLREAVDCIRIIKEMLPKLPMEEKKKYEPRKRIGVFDKGYVTKEVLPDGQPRFSEVVNIPVTGLLVNPDPELGLPPWLEQHQELFKRIQKRGYELSDIVFKVLEKGLELPEGALTSLHKLEDDSSDFLRLLRYPGFDAKKHKDQLTFPAHKDAISLAILFTWLGGLQIPAPDAVWLGHEEVTEESWRWVEPIPGTAIVNCGDALELLSNGTLKSGLHRVVRAPGEQTTFAKYSVLLGTRPRNDLPMKPLQSPVIPPVTEEQAKAPVYNSAEWGFRKIKGLGDLLDKRDKMNEVLVFAKQNGTVAA